MDPADWVCKAFRVKQCLLFSLDSCRTQTEFSQRRWTCRAGGGLGSTLVCDYEEQLQTILPLEVVKYTQRSEVEDQSMTNNPEKNKVHELWLDVSICSGRALHTQQTPQVIWYLISCVIFCSLSAHHVVELRVSFIFWILPLMSPWELYKRKHETWSLWTPSPRHELLCRSFHPAERQVITCDLFERVWWSIHM